MPDTDHEDDDPDLFWDDIDLDLSNATLIDISFAWCQVRKAVFSGARFTGTAKFIGARFDYGVFIRAQFADATTFGGTWFGSVDFTDARFDAAVDFNRVEIDGEAVFDGARYRDGSPFQPPAPPDVYGPRGSGTRPGMAEILAHHGLFHDTNLHVDDTGGPGRPVVLIHGWPLSGESWQDQVPALTAAGYRVVTYDRRGFGRSDKPKSHYDYDTLAEDLHTLVETLDLQDVTLVGFSMGGGEVARYCAAYGQDRLHSVVFAAAVTPYLLQADDNPDGPLPKQQAAEMSARLTEDEDAFYDQFTTDFFSANGELKVTEEQRRQARAMCAQADKKAALACMTAWATTDFRADLAKVTVPALVLHGDSDGTVPFEGSGLRTHDALPGSELRVLAGAPHGCTVSHAGEFNAALLDFLGK